MKSETPLITEPGIHSFLVTDATAEGLRIVVGCRIEVHYKASVLVPMRTEAFSNLAAWASRCSENYMLGLCSKEELISDSIEICVTAPTGEIILSTLR